MKHAVTGIALAILLVAGTAMPAAAQDAPARSESLRTELEAAVDRSGVVPALEALATAVAPELERSVDQLAATLNALATRIARDPELRSSAVRAARGMVDVAEIVVVEQSSALQEALRAAADRLEAIAAERERRTRD